MQRYEPGDAPSGVSSPDAPGPGAASPPESDPRLPLIHVPKGFVRWVEEPAVLRAMIGGEFVVAVNLPGRRRGGLIHLRELALGRVSSVQDLLGPLRSGAEKLLGRAVAEALPGAPAMAAVAGGGDLIGVLPQLRRAAIIEATADHLVDWLTGQGVRAHRLAVGGQQARRLSLDLASGHVSVEALPRTYARPSPEADATSGSAEPARTGSEIVVGIGEYRVARFPDRLAAILGSCVGIAIHDPESRLGGLAHAMMPRNPGDDPDVGRYADTAVPALIDALLQAGAKRRSLQAKLMGGARVLLAGSSSHLFRVAEENVAMSRALLGRAGIPVVGERVGGSVGCRVTIDLESFRILVKLLGSQRERAD